MRILVTVSLRFPRARFVRPGLVGPKARPKGVVDGQQVNIPVPLYWSDGGTQYVRRPVGMEILFGDERRAKVAGRSVGKSADH